MVIDENIVAACQEERFTRVKHDKSFPENAIESVLNIAKVPFSKVDKIIFYESIEKKFDRVMTKNLSLVPKSFKSLKETVNKWLSFRLQVKKEIIEFFSRNASEINWDSRIYFSEHHLSHAASAFYPSPFKESAILVVDGVGEWETTSIYKGSENSITKLSEIRFPHSLGFLYSAFTEFLGFKVNSGEYKVMGLAPYGRDIFTKLIKDKIIKIFDDGSFELNLEYFDFLLGDSMISNKFDKLFRVPRRENESNLTQVYADIAASIQSVTNEIMVKLSCQAIKLAGTKNLCLAGGVALNCVANSFISKNEKIENLWIQPASGDAGTAIGAALIGSDHNKKLKRPHVSKGDAMRGSYLGPEYNNKEIRNDLENQGAVFKMHDKNTLIHSVTELLINNKTIGWFQGRMEFGPRALGARSILGNPLNSKMQTILNQKIKYRESFRPFAPSVLAEDKEDYFEISTDSPYMLFVAGVKKNLRFKKENTQNSDFLEKIIEKRSTIPAVTHVDYTARIQTVDRSTNPLFHRLIETFKKKTQCAVLINTSFNVRGEPIVCTPTDAFRCFMATEMDGLAIGDFLLLKKEQPSFLMEGYHTVYDLD